MATLPYARKQSAPDTWYETFKAVKHSSRDGLNSASTVDNDTGQSPISRWLAYALDYSDFASNPAATGYIARCQIPRGTIALRCAVRVDVLFDGSASTEADVDIGDGNNSAGWIDSADFSGTGLVVGPSGAYQWDTDGTGAFYEDGDTLDISHKSTTAPTAGEAVIFLEVISYHEDLSAEW